MITPAKIKKLEKTPTTKPNPSFTTPSKATNQWVTPILRPICKLLIVFLLILNSNLKFPILFY